MFLAACAVASGPQMSSAAFAAPNPYVPSGSARPVVGRLITIGDSYSDSVDGRRPWIWNQQFLALGYAKSLTDVALIGASAAATAINGKIRSFAAQVDEWLALRQTLAPNDLTVVYFGQNDINWLVDIGPSKAALRENITRLISAGASADGRRILLVLCHNVARNPGAINFPNCKANYAVWKQIIPDIAASVPGVLMVDLLTAFSSIYGNPQAVGLTNTTTPSVPLSETTHLYRDQGHFGRKGHRLICQVVRYYLTSGWDSANTLVPGSSMARSRLLQDVAARKVFR
jgi:lysophospholipase L1-like esterase